MQPNTRQCIAKLLADYVETHDVTPMDALTALQDIYDMIVERMILEHPELFTILTVH